MTRWRDDEAERLYKEALEGRREALGPAHPDTLTSLNNLALLYQNQGRYGEAEQLHKEVLEERRRALGPAHPDTRASLSSLALVYQAQGRYVEAEPLYKELLEGQRATLGPAHPHMFASLSNLATVYLAQGRFGEAEPLYKEALEGRRRALGPAHPDTLTSLSNLAAVYEAQRSSVRRFPALGPGDPAAAAVEFDDERLASNPALARIADIDPAEAQRLLDAIEEVLRPPAEPRTRGFPGANAADQAVLEKNPMLRRALEAARDLLADVKEAGGGRRTHNAAATLELLKRVEEAGRR